MIDPPARVARVEYLHPGRFHQLPPSVASDGSEIQSERDRTGSRSHSDSTLECSPFEMPGLSPRAGNVPNYLVEDRIVEAVLDSITDCFFDWVLPVLLAGLEFDDRARARGEQRIS